MTANHHSRRSVRRQPGTAQSAGGGSSLSGSARFHAWWRHPKTLMAGGSSTHPAGGVNIPPVLSVIVGGRHRSPDPVPQPAEGQQVASTRDDHAAGNSPRGGGKGPQARQRARELIAAERAAGARLGAPAAPDTDRVGHRRPGHHRNAGRGQAELG